MRPLLVPFVIATCLSTGNALAQNDLTPPPPMDPNAQTQPVRQTPPTKTEQELKQSEKEDSGLGLEWLWLNAGGGLSHVNMTSFDSDTFNLRRDSATGGMFHVGAGVRLLFLTLGARLRNHALSAFSLWNINAEVGLHMRIVRVDPYLAFRGGYAFVGSLDSDSVAVGTGSKADDVAVRGFNLGMAFGLDYYFTKYVSLGGEVFGDLLFLKRPPVDLPAGFNDLPQAQKDQIQNDPLYRNSGSSVGYGLGGGLHLGFHL
jgi:hypothetical protein